MGPERLGKVKHSKGGQLKNPSMLKNHSRGSPNVMALKTGGKNPARKGTTP